MKIALLILLLTAIGFLTGYIASQKPKFWCDRQWAGIHLTKGGYRSWTLRFCDGETFVDGKLQPVVITPSGYRKGYFLCPKFSYVDMRKLKLEAGNGLMITQGVTNATVQSVSPRDEPEH